MRDNNMTFLKYLIQEDLYLIEDQNSIPPEIIENDKNNSKNSFIKEINGIVILVDYMNSSEIPELSGKLLDKILKAVNLTREESSIINLGIHKEEKNTSDSFRFTKCKIIGFLNQIPESWSLFLPDNKYMIIQKESCMILVADSLEVLYQDINAKKKLWTNLQILFNLSNR